MSNTKRINATEFKATCLNLMDRLNTGEWDSVEVTKRGKVVAVLKAAPVQKVIGLDDIYGAMADCTVLDPDIDLTAPIWLELLSDEDTALYV